MGSEYSIHPDWTGDSLTDEILEDLLCSLPDYHGKRVAGGQITYEFRGSNTREAPDTLPDVNVGLSGNCVTLCQFGDYRIAALVLGALVMELVSESRSERIEVVKP